MENTSKIKTLNINKISRKEKIEINKIRNHHSNIVNIMKIYLKQKKTNFTKLSNVKKVVLKNFVLRKF